MNENEIQEAAAIIDCCIKTLMELSAELKNLSNMAWVASESFGKLVKAKEDVEKAQKMMFSPQEAKREPSKETRERVAAWLGDDY